MQWTITSPYIPEKHIIKMPKHCRICACLAHRNSKSYIAANFADEVKRYHCIDISIDIELVHSNWICQPCYMQIYKLRKTLNPQIISSAQSKATLTASLWCHFDETVTTEMCQLCSHIQVLRNKGRPKKRKTITSNPAEPMNVCPGTKTSTSACDITDTDI